MASLNIIMRAVHILSAITLLGGVLAWLLAARSDDDASAVRWRPVAITAICGLLLSGAYNFLHKTGLPPEYHMFFGIKILLALHVFAVSLIAAKPANSKRKRQLTGVAISGVIVVILSAYLRSLTQ